MLVVQTVEDAVWLFCVLAWLFFVFFCFCMSMRKMHGNSFRCEGRLHEGIMLRDFLAISLKKGEYASILRGKHFARENTAKRDSGRNI